jgi:L,D-peptidoglycan transpeptidase YkuD (ErfK/YbiS/YcfS/YnhG family)
MRLKSAFSASRRAQQAVCGVVLMCALMTALLLGTHPSSVSRALAEETSGSAETSGSTNSSATTGTPKISGQPMASVGDAQQVIVATGSKLGAKYGTLRFFDYVGGAWVCTMTAPARFGKRGLMDGNHRWAGNKTTPTGLWKMPDYVFGYRKSAPSGTKMKYRRINGRTWWSSKRGSTYNKWKQARRWPGEYLYGVVPQYELAVSMGYNAAPNRVKYGRGTGIFLHVKKGPSLTSGCVAISRSDMIRVCRLLNPRKKPTFAVGTLKHGAKTSIWAY